MRFRANQRNIYSLVLIGLVILTGVVVIGQMPIHRTNIQYTDVLGDVNNSDIDIIEIRSHQDGSNIVLELIVEGQIQTSTNYLYSISITAKGVADTSSHIYACTFQDGQLTSYGFDTEIDNDTLRIFFPLSAFVSDSYMIGLEGHAYSPDLEEDFTSSDRDGDVARVLFRIW